jgi:hypothetical protein
MNNIVRSAALGAAAFVMTSSAMSQEAPQLVESVNIASLKAIFDNAKVPATVETSGGGVRFVLAELQGFWILAVPADCPNSDQNGTCKSVALLSAVWKIKPGLEMLNRYAAANQRLSMPMAGEDGQPLLRYVFSVNGVAANYVEDRMVDFFYEQKEFEQALNGSKPASPGFSVAGGAKVEKAVNAAAALAALPAPRPSGKLSP